MGDDALMPVIHVQGLPPQPGVDLDAALAAVCREVAQLLGEDPRGTWATWRTLARYTEGDVGAAIQPAETHPPFARLVALEGRDAALIDALLRCVAETLVRELRLAEGNVFVTYDEVRRGRLYTGGDVV